MKLRIMMRMMGLGSVAYWVINYLFWFLIYVIFTSIFVLLGSVGRLPSGYTIGIFTKQDYGSVVRFLLVFSFVVTFDVGSRLCDWECIC